MSVVAAVRIRGHRKVRTTTEDALRSLRLTRANHCVVVPASQEYLGQLQKAKDYLTWGPVDAKQVAELIRTRGRLEGDAPVTDAVVAKGTKYKSIDEFAQAIALGEAKYDALPNVTPIFRLMPPRKGFKGGTKRSVAAHGNLGDRGPKMGELLKRMI